VAPRRAGGVALPKALQRPFPVLRAGGITADDDPA
jgi:hypothetical protein